MLDDDIVTVPAGWYPDPMGLPQLRWWDNYAWTEFTSAARSPLIVQDDPKLAYADDDLPSRRSQREQRQQGDDRRQTDNPVDLASTLRQLEPPKPQNIERDQPAPDVDSTTPNTPTAEELREQQQAHEQQVREQQARDEQARQDQAREQQRHEQREQQQQQRTRGPEADPFAEFLSEPATSFTEPPLDQPRYGERPNAGAGGYGQQQQQPATGFAPQFDSGRDGAGQFGYAPQAQTRNGSHAPLAYTPFVWIIAMIPLIQLVGILLVVSAVDVAIAMPFLATIAIAPYVAGIPLAIADHHHLKRMGHQHPAHWAWSVLTSPVYLVVRAIAASREHGKGLTPLLVWAALSLLQVASIIAVPGILISAMPAVFSAEVEESIESDSAIAGRELAVSCPETPPVQIGGTFNCTGVLAATGEEVGIVVRLQRANGWIDWRVYGMVWENSTTAGTVPDAAVVVDGEVIAP